MAGIIKKQILKHLSRFTKNLSPDKINLSTLKGEGQLTNLELDEEVLQNVLELPTWLAITRVYCNRASIRIQWTKLRTHPICLCLDKVEVEMKTCEEPRPPNGQSPIALASGQSEYGFAEKVVEGMFIIVNSITIKIHSKAFHASFELWQLQGYSVNPSWQQSDLHLTRITDPRRGEVLTFKEITWQTLRIEADATDNGDQDAVTTPLRLITNQGRIQIALKRRTKDCNVIASKLMFLLDDLLWVLTDSQLKAMMKYAESLSEAMEKAAQQRKSLAPEPVQITPPAASAQQSWAQAFSGSQANSNSSSSRLSKYFEKFDVKESSYHLLISRLDLHICDDSQLREPGISANRLMGGAMQLTFRKMAFDYYPFHWAGDSCKHWVRHCEAMETRGQWAQQLVMEFQSKMEKWHEETDSLPSPRRNTLERSPSQGRQAAFRPPAWNRLRSSCMVVRVDDLDIYQVSTAGQPSKKPSTLLSCSRKLYNLPTQVSAIHIEFTEYYFPDNQELPVPCSNLYVQLNGLTFTVDPVSLLWGNLFCLDLYHSLEQFKAIYKLEDSRQKDEHLDIRLDAFRLKVSFPLEKREEAGSHRPQALAISASGMTATNTRHAPHCSCPDLQSLFRGFTATEFFHSSYVHFPKVPGGFSLLHMLFLHHAFQMESRLSQPSTFPPKRPTASQDLWSLHFVQISLDFEGTENFKGRALNFVAPFPLSIWACLPLRWQQAEAQKLLSSAEGRLKPSASFGSPVPSEVLAPDHQPRSKTEHDLKSLSGLTDVMEVLREGSGSVDSKAPLTELEDAADVHLLVHSPAHVRVRLDHYQYLALLRLKEVLQALQEQLAKDTEAMTGSALQSQTACIGVLFPSAEVALLMHPAPGAGVDATGSDTTSLVDSELSPSEDREPKSDASSDPGPASPEKVLENSDVETRPASRDGPPPLHGNGELQDPGALAQQLAEEGHEAVESLQAKGRSRVQASSSPAALQSPGGRDTPVSGQGELTPLRSIEGELSSAMHITKDATKEALHATMDLTKEAVSLTKGAFSLGRDRMTSTVHKMLALPPAKEPMAKIDEGTAAPASGGAARLRFFSMERTVSQQSFDGVSLDSSGPEDQISVDSDGSDSFVMLLESESGSGCLPPGSLPDVLDGAGAQGSPVVDNYGQGSPEANSSVSPSGEDLSLHPVSVLVLKVNEVSFGIEVHGEDLAVALQAEELALHQLGTMGLWQFLHGQHPDTCVEEPSALKPGHIRPAVGLRFEVGPGAAVHSPLAIQNGFLHFLLRDCDLELLTSVLNGLGPFLTDEEIPVIVPMQIELLNSRITLKDDIPPIYPPPPGPVPITLAMEHIVLTRRDDGVFHIGAAAEDRPPTEAPKSEKRQPLREQMYLVPTVEAFGQQVKQLPVLQKELTETKQALANANQDKEKLLQEIRKYNPFFEL
ncbi:bridge-like lipid transfer protein family member 3A isoform X2 [Dasypus novemcinctus]|uniref:bridge-like lipid transfer protein family member 3A isoform X2 n=1 Tax=Dasypus novemcinctus TaxID=9361 RepID=UPI00265EAEA6|nr:bridge-like lipid transfer protein family member 3A isoform X2 [Dasypus novemcinctus]